MGPVYTLNGFYFNVHIAISVVHVHRITCTTMLQEHSVNTIQPCVGDSEQPTIIIILVHADRGLMTRPYKSPSHINTENK